ncbi:hypothetical protein SAMN02745724_02776 [Pseudoalteromonas denitrificans DSM 6059]|uniref:Uncharacterized protein n=1 Tax=Pseudoalteromonas denitrificans DSM 6059 TaxID=1123010 RepID=A0A1I1MQ40_9GAMM|nr:hypothetical protein SAMN02745724_02776 [Pseudoalteromonas denitrificans DSM 6059]
MYNRDNPSKNALCYFASFNLILFYYCLEIIYHCLGVIWESPILIYYFHFYKRHNNEISLKPILNKKKIKDLSKDNRALSGYMTPQIRGGVEPSDILVSDAGCKKSLDCPISGL